jgi:hypothetical protein
VREKFGEVAVRVRCKPRERSARKTRSRPQRGFASVVSSQFQEVLETADAAVVGTDAMLSEME